ncbi:MAG: hypothetical protein K1X51_13815 [Rhodospirillaceae bacterium]|nr:hypothetical protein [Rhodospirillaceae bacterium]
MKLIAKISIAAFAMASLGVPAMARDGADGKPLTCINLMSMGDTPVINETTVLIHMKAGNTKYKRMDLAGPCNGIEYKGFSHQSSYNELCTSDTLISNVTPGAVCKIDKIVDISDTEAKDLMKRK